MKSILTLAALAATGMLCFASAHAQQQYDTSRKVVVTGKVYLYEPMLPNNWIFIEVTGVDDTGAAKAGATSNWGVNGRAETMTNQGLTPSMLATGTVITATGFRGAKDCAVHPATQKTTCILDARQIKLPNGCTYLTGAQDGFDKPDNSKCKPG